jgi:hypothetical protein
MAATTAAFSTVGSSIAFAATEFGDTCIRAAPAVANLRE